MNDVFDSGDPAVLDVRTNSPGPKGQLPITPEMLRSRPSGDIFGWTQDAGMGWNPSELGRKEFLILSTIVAADPGCAATASCPVGYGWKGGTSMATPHVSGVAALVKDANPGMNPNAVESKLKDTAENIGSRQEFGQGMVRADLATQ